MNRLSIFLLILFVLAGSLLAVPVKAQTSYYGLSFKSGSYVEVSEMNFSNITIAALFKLDTDPTTAPSSSIVFKQGSFQFSISNTSGKLWWGMWGASLLSNTVLKHGVYYLAAITFDNTTKTARWYVNGILDSSAVLAKGISSTSNPLYVGLKADTDGTFPGEIYLILIYNRTLNSTEIKQIYENPLDPPTVGLVLWYAPDSVDTVNGLWLDKSGNGNDGQIVGATPVRVSIPKLSVYNIENNSEIPLQNVSVSLISNNTTTSLIPSLLTLPYNKTVTLNVSATGFKPRLLTTPSDVTSLTIFLQPVQNTTYLQNITPPTETITPLFQLSNNYNDHGLWGGRLGIFFLTGNWSEGFSKFWTLNPMFELVLPLIFAFALILSSYLITRKPLVPIGVTAVTASFFGMLGVPLQLSVATPLAALFVFWIVYTLWDFYKKFEKS